ncbi:MAG: hypothetical protein ACXWZB_05810 [Gaiellaceae bacterium]
MTNRAGLERRVDELADEHSGQAFAEAIKALADELDADDAELLKRIVLERATNFDQAVMDRLDSRGWFRRQWDRAATPFPPRDR